MKIYFGCALTHAPDAFQESIEGFKDSLREKYELLDFVGVLDDGCISAQQVYEHDRSCVLNCDIFIGECSYPSTGLGYEIATALEFGKRVILMAHTDSLVTRMILGIPPEKAIFLRYNDTGEVLDFIFKNY